MTLTVLTAATLDVLPLVSVTVSYINPTTSPPSDRRRVASQTVEARRALRREELLDAATRAIQREGPDVSMDSLAAEAGVTKPILYRHFGDKGGLCHALAERQFDAIQNLAGEVLTRDEDPRRVMVPAIDGFLALKEANAPVFRFLERQAAADQPELQGALEYFADRCARSFAELLHPRLVARGVDPRAIEPWTRAMIGAVMMVGDWWIQTRPMPRAELVDHLVALFRGGMLLEEAAP